MPMKPIVATLLASSAAAAKLSPTLPYPASTHPTTSVFVVSSQGRSPAELVCLDTFAGLLARDTPTAYRVADSNWAIATDSTAAWLREMRANGVKVNTSLVNASVPHFVAAVAAAAASKALPGYVLADGATQCDEQRDDASLGLLSADRTCDRDRVWSWTSADSISAGLTMAAAADGLIVAADPQLASGLEAVGVARRADVRTQTVGDVLKLPGVLGNLSTSIYIWQVRARRGRRRRAEQLIAHPCLTPTVRLDSSTSHLRLHLAVPAGAGRREGVVPRRLWRLLARRDPPLWRGAERTGDAPRRAPRHVRPRRGFRVGVRRHGQIGRLGGAIAGERGPHPAASDGLGRPSALGRGGGAPFIPARGGGRPAGGRPCRQSRRV